MNDVGTVLQAYKTHLPYNYTHVRELDVGHQSRTTGTPQCRSSRYSWHSHCGRAVSAARRDAEQSPRFLHHKYAVNRATWPARLVFFLWHTWQEMGGSLPIKNNNYWGTPMHVSQPTPSWPKALLLSASISFRLRLMFTYLLSPHTQLTN